MRLICGWHTNKGSWIFEVVPTLCNIPKDDVHIFAMKISLGGGMIKNVHPNYLLTYDKVSLTISRMFSRLRLSSHNLNELRICTKFNWLSRLIIKTSSKGDLG